MVKKILLIVAHQDIENSRANKRIIHEISNLPNVTIHYIYDRYPDFKINVKEEQTLLLDADLIVFQFPFYWYSSPAILKQWFDDVLQFGFAFGPEGKALHGKDMCLSITIGGPAKSYQAGDGCWNNFSINEFLKPFQQTASLCGLNYLAPLYIHGTPNIVGLDMSTVPGIDIEEINLNIEKHASRVKDFLIEYSK